MSPRRVHALWQKRWNKQPDASARTPYLNGHLNDWGNQLASNDLWSRPGITWLTCLSCLTMLWLITWVTLPTTTQILFSLCLVGTALYLRRYKGMLVTLILVGISLVVSSRYLAWRFSTILNLDFGLVSVLALSLFFAELYFWTVTTLNCLTAIWPLKRTSAQLPTDRADWPTVDVFMISRGGSIKEIQHAAITALALEWPGTKLKIYLIVDQTQAGLEKIVKITGANWLVLPDSLHDEAEIVKWTASQTKGSLIAVLPCDQSPHVKFLTKAVGWFAKDSTLGMIYTPFHFLAPEASPDYSGIFLKAKPGIVCALIRRTALVSIEKIDFDPALPESRSSLQDQEHGHRNALIGYATTKAEDSQRFDERQDLQPSLSIELFLVDNPSGTSSLLWKKRLNSLQEFFNFYYFVPKFVFLIAPLVYFLGGMNIIQAAPVLLLSYLIPHVVHAYFLAGRVKEKDRLTIWGDIKQVVLAWYLLLPTATSLMRTEFRTAKNLFGAHKKMREEPFDWMTAGPYGVVLSLNLIGLFVGIQYEWTIGEFQDPVSLMYLIWIFFNILLLMAAFAVARESQHLRQHGLQQLRHAVMIQLPSGRTLTGVTNNFPDLMLEVNLPVKPKLEIGTIIGLSIFQGQKESTFSAQVVVNSNACFRLTISENSRNAYQLMGTLALSRDERWPKWLPGRDADRPLPKWVGKLLAVALGKIVGIAGSLDLPSKVNLLASWITYWKKTT